MDGAARFSLSVIPVLRGEMEDRFCKEDKGGKVLCFYHITPFFLSVTGFSRLGRLPAQFMAVRRPRSLTVSRLDCLLIN